MEREEPITIAGYRQAMAIIHTLTISRVQMGYLLERIEAAEAKVQEAMNVANWIRDNHGDYISREIEERLLTALGSE